MALQRMMFNICSDDLPGSRDFYVRLFGFAVNFDSDWFIQLRDEAQSFELGIIDRTHEMVPENFQVSPTGIYPTFVVEDVELTYQKAQEAGYDIVAPPAGTFYGQRRLLLKDPNGMLVDVSSLMK
ncbi:MAG: VOC family protein [Bacteroidota bacterium]